LKAESLSFVNTETDPKGKEKEIMEFDYVPGPPNLSLPGNPRYQPEALQKVWGYDNLYRALAEIEIATMEVLGEIGVIPPEEISLLGPVMKEQLLSISTSLVDAVERRVTKHDVRAWVRLAQERLPVPLRRWVHVPLTSYDALDTARALQFLRAHRQVVHPMAVELIQVMADKVEETSDIVQIGRTHGQHALPITVGFWLATALSRFLYNVEMMDSCANGFGEVGLVGKISGAVGAYNAQVGLGISKRCGETSFEERVLAKLDLLPARISTQILPPEPLAYYLFSCTMMSAALAQLGNDCRHLMRTEIGEIGEPFAAGQVGSSTMAHKRNPINYENTVGMWVKTRNELGKVLDTLVSEHQRDLTGSSVMRDFPIIVINLVQQMSTLLRKGGSDKRPFLSRITVDRKACNRNFKMQAGVVTAEPIYLALQMAGYEGDAHELVNHQLMPRATQDDMSLATALRQMATEDSALWQVVQRIPPEVLVLLGRPEDYIGLAREKAQEVVDDARRFLNRQRPD